MSKHISATRFGRTLRRLLRHEQGNALIGFALILPILIALTFGIIEFSLVVFDFHRAGEATRRGARDATISDSVSDDMSALADGTPIECGVTSGVLSCTSGNPQQSNFDAILADMQAILPGILPQNVQIIYKNSGLGDATTPGGILPLVTVRLVNIQHNYLVLQVIPGITDSFIYPPFTANQMAGGQG